MAGRFIQGGWSRAEVQPYSDVKADRGLDDGAPLPIGLIVEVQQLAAKGRTVDQIVEATRIPRNEVVRLLDDEAKPRKPARPARAQVAYGKVKAMWQR
jgi:hypothetical protein